MIDKKKVFDFWDEASCGEDMLLSHANKAGYTQQTLQRYFLEPYIEDFAEFSSYKGKKVLEIGIGLGADHQKFAENGATLFGVDLTQRAIEHVTRRFEIFDLSSSLSVGDAENLEFESEMFDLVYSWGVIHHTPDTTRAIEEIFRVLKPGGRAKIMIYHKWSMIGFMLWLRYGLLRLRPFTSLSKIYSLYLESPGTKAYTVTEGYELFSKFHNISIDTVLTHGDLLTSKAGQRHKGIFLNIARAIWPRFFLRRFLSKSGLFMLVDAEKP